MRVVLLCVLALGYAILAHFSTVRAEHGVPDALLALAPVGSLSLALAFHLPHRMLGLALWFIAAAAMASIGRVLASHLDWIYLIQQVGIYSLLALFFGHSLAAGRAPLCTQMARREYGALPDVAVRYTRKVTVAWTMFFVAITAALLLLFFSVSLKAWSAFANFVTPALVILLFAVENRVRRRALPGMMHGGLVSTVRAVAGYKSAVLRS